MEKCTPQNQLDLKDIKVKARVKKVKVKKNNLTQKNFFSTHNSSPSPCK